MGEEIVAIHRKTPVQITRYSKKQYLICSGDAISNMKSSLNFPTLFIRCYARGIEVRCPWTPNCFLCFLSAFCSLLFSWSMTAPNHRTSFKHRCSHFCHVLNSCSCLSLRTRVAEGRTMFLAIRSCMIQEKRKRSFNAAFSLTTPPHV